MFRLSTRSRYAVRALIELATNPGPVPVPVARISTRQRIPRPFLEQILYRLNRAGVVESVRGPAGGYRLKKDAAALKLSDIVGILERPGVSRFCLGDDRTPNECRKPEGCFSSVICRSLDERFNKTLNRVTLKHIVAQWKRSNHGRQQNDISRS